MKNSLQRKKQGGWLDISLGTVFTVVGIMSAAALFGAAALYSSADSSVVETKSRSIVSDVKSVYRNSTDLSALTNTTAISAKIIPKDWITGTSTAQNNNGGIVTLVSEDVVGTDDGFSLQHTLFDEDECLNYVNGMFADSYQIDVDGTTVKTAGGSTINATALSTSCGDSGSNTVKTVHTKS